ncbi:carbamoyltransferase C-terminal domain-containing protein [Burkholderia sp. LMG 21824]|uniref:carbamoyltransferase C-terminal domain-containing protein n=1 Tax=Burkholderia sp. LMG 21824 TaxID=3158172 RepID=UPI003C2B00CC
MNANLIAASALSLNGAGCRIAVYDDTNSRAFRRIQDVLDPDEHVRRITGFLTDERLHGIARGSEVISVNALDCILEGYDVVKTRLVDTHGLIHIEAHAYSCPAGKATAAFEGQFTRNARDSKLRSLVLCSPGHDPFRVRFPATSNNVVSVGLVRSDGTVVGAGLGDLLKPALLLSDEPFPALSRDGRLVPVTGTSPAVTFVAGLAAMLYERSTQPATPSELYAGLLLLTSPFKDTFLLNQIDVLHQAVGTQLLEATKSRRRSVRIRVTRNTDPRCRLSLVGDACVAESLAPNHQFALSVTSTVDGIARRTQGQRVVLAFDELGAGERRDVTLEVSGLAEGCAIAWTGAQLEVLDDSIVPVKNVGDHVVVGISASHDASAVLSVNGELIAGIQLERLTRVKHDGESSLSHDDAIQYCLSTAGLTATDVDTFAFNIQALTPGYVGLSQPLARKSFTLFDPLGDKALFVSHHLCHAFAGFSGSTFDSATVIVADGSGGVAVGASDLILDGRQLGEYLGKGKGADQLRLHTFSVYTFDQAGFQLKHREYARSFNVRSGSESLGETYASVSQFVFNSWQASGKLMGLAPYGSATPDQSYLERGEDGELNFSFKWKLSTDGVSDSSDVMRFSNLAARIQQDLEIAILDRFQRHVEAGDNVVFTGGIALNAVANSRIRSEIRPRELFLLPAQHDAGVAIGAAAAAVFRSSGKVPSRFFRHDFLGYRYSDRDVALAINQFADRLKVRRVTPGDIASGIADGAVYGFFSLRKGSEFGPRALGARSILADPRKRSVWQFVNKWVKYREEFRPFAPMVAADALSDYFEARGYYPYMLEVVKVREAYRSELAGITHVDASARVQTVSSSEDPEIYALLAAFHAKTGFPVLMNTSFNVRGQPVVEQPIHAIEMLLSTQLSGVIFGDLLVEIMDAPDTLGAEERLMFSPGTGFEFTADTDGTRGAVKVRSQGKMFRVSASMIKVLQALSIGCTVADATSRAGQDTAKCLDTLHRYVRLRILNRTRTVKP